MIEECWRDECEVHKGALMSSGKYKKKHPFNPVQIKNGLIVRLNKNGTVRSILGALADIKKGKK